MGQYNLWISNYHFPSDQLRTYTDRVIKKEYPSMAGKTIRVYVRSRDSARDDITDQLEALRSEGRLRSGDSARLRGVFCHGDWTVKGARVVREPPE